MDVGSFALAVCCTVEQTSDQVAQVVQRDYEAGKKGCSTHGKTKNGAWIMSLYVVKTNNNMHPTLHTICHNQLHEKERLNFEAHFFKTTSLLHVSNSQLWSAGQVVDPIPTNLSGTLFSSLLLKSSVWVS